VVALAVMLRGADAGSSAAVDQEEIDMVRHGVHSSPTIKGSEAGKVPWRAVPVELTPNSVKQRSVVLPWGAK